MFCAGFAADLALPLAAPFEVEEEEEEAARNKSPRTTASAMIMDLPPRVIWCVPWIWDRREILFPVSFMPVRLCHSDLGACLRIGFAAGWFGGEFDWGVGVSVGVGVEVEDEVQ